MDHFKITFFVLWIMILPTTPVSAVLPEQSGVQLEQSWVKAENLPAIFKRIQAQAEQSAIAFDTQIMGYSFQGKPIWRVALGNPKAQRKVLWVCGQHGDEPDSIQACLYLLRDIVHDPVLQKGLETSQIHMIPLLNPDGYQQRTRKNARGVNLNANWGFGWNTPLLASAKPRFLEPSGASFRGTKPFSEPETQALKTFVEHHDFQLLVDYHTGVAGFSQGMVLYPFTHSKTDSLTLAQKQTLYPLALEQSQALSLSSLVKDPVLAFQSHEVLPYLKKAIRQYIPEQHHVQALRQLPESMQSPGSLIDWTFGVHGISALAFEIYFPVDDLSEERIKAFNLFYQELQPGLHRSVIKMLQ